MGKKKRTPFINDGGVHWKKSGTGVEPNWKKSGIGIKNAAPKAKSAGMKAFPSIAWTMVWLMMMLGFIPAMIGCVGTICDGGVASTAIMRPFYDVFTAFGTYSWAQVTIFWWIVVLFAIILIQVWYE